MITRLVELTLFPLEFLFSGERPGEATQQTQTRPASFSILSSRQEPSMIKLQQNFVVIDPPLSFENQRII